MYPLVLYPYSKLCFCIIDSNFLLVKIRKQREYNNNIYKHKLIFYPTTMFPFTYFLKESQCWGERNLSHFKIFFTFISALERAVESKQIIFLLSCIYTGQRYLTGALLLFSVVILFNLCQFTCAQMAYWVGFIRVCESINFGWDTAISTSWNLFFELSYTHVYSYFYVSLGPLLFLLHSLSWKSEKSYPLLGESF